MTEIHISTRNRDRIVIGPLQAKYSVDGTRILRYFIDFRHKELDVHKQLSAPEIYLLQHKVNALMNSWDKKFAETQRKFKNASGKEAADQITAEATALLNGLSRLLHHTLRVDDRINWERLKDRTPYKHDAIFDEVKPQRESLKEPQYEAPNLTFWDTLLGRKEHKLTEAFTKFRLEKAKWAEENKKREVAYTNRLSGWNQRREAFFADAERREQQYLHNQALANAKIDALAHGVTTGNPSSIIEHATLVLENSDYGSFFEKSFEIDYSPSERMLLLEYQLPSPDNMPTVKSARFVPATGEIKETHISDRDKKAIFDLACYQICLRTIHELFEADENNNIDNILFNGIVTATDKSTGRDSTSCIMSVLVKRADFLAIDLSRVDPKACFKSLKGVSASTLSALVAIPPVIELNKEDRRFVEARNTFDSLNSSMNLAAMDWEDFEHLVRELFEKEFASRGGEVKITQSSSDGGVDAVAFDPDPITGGKIVIQAKRYTQTVGVSAVRDLYGTMQHEGASRGILITTADYGPDAHKFASGKPISLFSGSNLLHMLSRHGYNAKIDLREARKELRLRER